MKRQEYKEKGKEKKSRRGVFFLAIACGGILFFFLDRENLNFSGKNKVIINDDGIVVTYSEAEGRTVGEILERVGIHLREKDEVWPRTDERVYARRTIYIDRSREGKIQIDGRERLVLSRAETVGGMFLEEGISLDEDDIVKPERSEYMKEGMRIAVTRVEIREEVKETVIPYEIKTNEDEKMSWRKKVTTQKGERGIKQTIYRVAYHDGKEVSRKITKTEVSKEPVPEIITQGTHVELGKSHRGAASWYAWTGTMAAANPWLPKGSYVKVTNLDNGKSVIVVINDRGPFVPGRIIDLDKVAFAKIASIGAGVINVKMEEIIN